MPPLVRAVGLGIGVLVGSAMLLASAHQSTDSERQWDLVAFWLAGKTAVEGNSPYVPGAYVGVELPLEVGDGFRHEVIEVGDLYPPITLLLFAPLGLVPLATARILWLGLSLAALATCVFLLARRLPVANGHRFLLVAGVLLGSRGTFTTLSMSQTNFLVMALVLLFFASSRPVAQGLFLALGALVKPWLVLFLLPCLLLGRRRAAVWASGFLGLMVLAVSRIFGRELLFDYLLDPPFLRRPLYVFSEGNNDSLQATIQRLLPVADPLLHPGFLLFGVLLTAVSIWVAVETRKSASGTLWMMFLCLALMLYPGTLDHYLVLLVLPVLHLFVHRDLLPWSEWQTALHLALVLGLAAWPIAGLGFLALLYCWGLNIVLAYALRGGWSRELESFFGSPLDLSSGAVADTNALKPAFGFDYPPRSSRGLPP